MQVAKLEVNKDLARELYQQYKKHQHYSEPIDKEIQRAYQHLSKGKLIIKALESIVTAGLNDYGMPKLAIAEAHAKTMRLFRDRMKGSFTMTSRDNSWRASKRDFHWPDKTFEFPAITFPLNRWGNEPAVRASRDIHEAQVPLIPIHLRPKRGLENYHILFEAEWRKVPPKDPFLLRRIGDADMWLVVAAWDLTEVERAALASRITVN